MLKRRVMDPVKLVLRMDGAIGEGADYDKYTETWDQAHLNLKPGETPTVFTIKQLTDRQRDACHRGDTLLDKCTIAIRYGLVSVDNYMLQGPGGSEALSQPDLGNGEHGRVITDAWLDKARFLTDEKVALGGTILAITEARPPLS